jgi:hypothetical protein
MADMKTNLRDVTASYAGHVLQRSISQGHVLCLHCPLVITDQMAVEGVVDLEPCPGTEEGRALLAEAEREVSLQAQTITEPCIATPPDWEGTDAEAIGLAVAGAVADLSTQRDWARAELATARNLVAELVEKYPATSFAGPNAVLERAKGWLEDTAPSDDQ